LDYNDLKIKIKTCVLYILTHYLQNFPSFSDTLTSLSITFSAQLSRQITSDINH